MSRPAYHKLTRRRQDHASRAHAKFARMPMPACSEWDPFPSRAKKNVPSTLSQPIPWLWPTGPSLAMLAASEYHPRTRKERFFRTGKPVPNSALLATNIASIGGAGVRHCEDGWGRFFFRPGRARVRWCCIAMLCVCKSTVWSMDLVVFVRRGYKQGCGGRGGLDGYAAQRQQELPMGATHSI